MKDRIDSEGSGWKDLDAALVTGSVENYLACLVTASRHGLTMWKRHQESKQGCSVSPEADDRAWDTVTDQVRRAGFPLVAALKALHEHAVTFSEPAFREVANHIVRLFPRVLPFLVNGHHIASVQHTAHVIRNIVELCIGESCQPHETLALLIAALFHDAALGDCVLPKITEEQIQQLAGAERDAKRKEAIAGRLEHMELACGLFREIVSAYLHEIGGPTQLFSRLVFSQAVALVGEHDNAKIPLLGDLGKRWFLGTDRNSDDWLKQLFWEGDAAWMLLDGDGLREDIIRQNKPDGNDTRIGQWAYNVSLHRSIVDIYRAVTGSQFAMFGFRDGLLYRSNTGSKMINRFRVTMINERLPVLLGDDSTQWTNRLLQHSSDSTATMRATTADIIGVLGPLLTADELKLLVSSLYTSTRDVDGSVRTAAQQALFNLGSPLDTAAR